MTISTTNTVAGPFAGNDSATTFPFTDIKVNANADLVVILTDVAGAESTLVETVDYTLVLNSDQDASPGGTITYPVSGDPLATGEKLTGKRTVTKTQSMDLKNQGKYSPVVVETSADRAMMVLQELQEEVDRAVKVSISSEIDPDTLVASIETSESNAAASASLADAERILCEAETAKCQNIYDNFDDRWLGDKASDPALDNDGNALLTGAAYFNTTVNLLRIYDGAIWNDIGSSSASVYEFTATASQTTFTGLDDNSKTLSYKVGYVQVSRNGVILPSSAYTASNGTSVVLDVAADLNDDIVVFSFGALNTTDTYTKAEVDNIINAINSVEIGSVVVIPDTVIPTGYLECNGASLDTTTYADLFAVLGYKYGGAAASFNIPDYRGEFLRGFDNGAANDPDRATRTDRGDGTTGDVVGSKQADQVTEHAHGHRMATLGSGSASGDIFYNGNPSYEVAQQNGGNTGGNETRPRNVNVMYCIKF